MARPAAQPVTNPLLACYLAEMSGTLSPKTSRAYRHVLTRLDHLPLTLEEARAWKARRMSQVSPATVQAEMRALRSFDKWYSVEMDTEPLLEKLSPPKVIEGEKAPIVTQAEFDALLATCGTDRMGRRDEAILRLFWSTGARLGEVAVLRVSDLDLGLSTVQYRGTKNGSTRTSYLTPDARRALRRYLAAWDVLDGPLWLGERGAAGDAMVSRMLRRRSKEAGLSVTAHQFRRSYAVRWLLAGGSEVMLMQTAGWRSVSMIAKYVREVRSSLALAEAARLFG